MASLQKLSIRGVRSFSPEDDEQAGHSFVHDPKSVNQSSVKASIKLRFTNKASRTMVVIRSMEVIQKKSTMQFKALDGVLRSTNAAGEKISLSHKCSELDRQIPSLIGVSKPILEHVVFCHQEDSSWPLQEGAVLKKRFDEIFDSTRYAKALDALRKSKTEYNGKMKDIAATLAGLQAHLHAAEGLHDDLQTSNSNLEKLEEKNQKIEKEVDELETKQQEYEKVLAERDDLREAEDKIKYDLRSTSELASSQMAMLETDMSSTSLSDLQHMLSNFDESVSEIDKGYEGKVKEFEGIKKQVQEVQDERIEKCSGRGVITAEKETNDIAIATRLSLCEEISSKFYVPFSGDSSDSNIKSYVSKLDAEKKKLLDNLKEVRRKNQVEDDELSSRMGELTAKQRNLEDSSRSNSETRSYLEEKLNDVFTQSQSSSRISKIEVDDAIRAAEKLVQERDNLSSNQRLTEIPKEIKTREAKLHSLSLITEEQKEGLEQLRLCEDDVSSLETLQRDCNHSTSEINETLKDLIQRYPNFKEVLTPCNAEEVESVEKASLEVMEMKREGEEDLKKKQDAFSSKNKQFTESSALLQNSRSRVDELICTIADLQKAGSSVSKIKEIASSQRTADLEHSNASTIDLQNIDAQSLLSGCRDILKSLDAGVTEGHVKKFVKKLKKMVQVKDDQGGLIEGKCPCCNRGFGNGDDFNAEDFEQMKSTLEKWKNPATTPFLSDADKEQDSETKEMYAKWVEEIQEGLPEWSELKRAEETLVTLQGTVARDTKTLEVIRAEKDVAEVDVTTATKKVSNMEKISTSTSRLLDDCTRVSSLRSDVEAKKGRLKQYAPQSEGKTLREVERQIEETGRQKENLMKFIQDLNKEMANVQKRLQVVTQRCSSAEKIASEKKETYSKYGGLEKARAEMREGIERCNDLDAKLRSQEAPIRQQIASCEAEKATLRKKHDAEAEAAQKSAGAFANKLVELMQLQSKVKAYKDGGGQQRLDELNASISSIEAKIADLDSQLKEMEPEMLALKSKTGDKERHRKSIRDNISYRETLEKIAQLEKDAEDMAEEISQIAGDDTFQEKFDECAEEISELSDKKNRLEGQRQAMVEQSRQLEKKLNLPEYKGVTDDHRKTMIELETTKIAVQDLEKYHNAVDRALLRYHSIKIEDINKIIKELWSLTYKGSDITNIRIVSDAAKSTRSYNYRVVMSKGSTEMDMRGRCSAGQRVLASIVIRLALAETFCISCGVLALDEPTTNLDHDNKRGLAMALSQIIANRAQQHNFQLLAITHDEDFCDMMKNELAAQQGGNFQLPDSYFYVNREEGTDGKFYSKISKVGWEDL
ncbi:hypothetical protein TrLO_g15735 [Triparma laevis f. longispina]|uniref:DNA repair protein RAD50 n=1 Tax=Triparma laevis f. longispina TaxID=1714387 RepID=A0A9W7CE54_9STRA|nr:hypothetical protein TrLO_g15735 [Triparma laevis f. longispina]